MNEKQIQTLTARLIKANEESTNKIVKETVNGKIDILRAEIKKHSEKHERDMEDIKPVIEAYKGTKVVGEMMKWISSVGLGAWGLWMLLKGIK